MWLTEELDDAAHRLVGPVAADDALGPDASDGVEDGVEDQLAFEEQRVALLEPRDDGEEVAEAQIRGVHRADALLLRRLLLEAGAELLRGDDRAEPLEVLELDGLELDGALDHAVEDEVVEIREVQLLVVDEEEVAAEGLGDDAVLRGRVGDRVRPRGEVGLHDAPDDVGALDVAEPHAPDVGLAPDDAVRIVFIVLGAPEVDAVGLGEEGPDGVDAELVDGPEATHHALAGLEQERAGVVADDVLADEGAVHGLVLCAKEGRVGGSARRMSRRKQKNTRSPPKQFQKSVGWESAYGHRSKSLGSPLV
jgi:hypothetical protein